MRLRPAGRLDQEARLNALWERQNHCRSHRLPTPLVWIEHWPKEAMDGEEETFELVVFSSYKVEERAPYLEETRAWIGEATWKTLDRTAVELLVGGKV
jgi:hypothetical protein